MARLSPDKSAQPLPPTFESNLPGLPGFHATIAYSLSVVVSKSKSTLFCLGNSWVPAIADNRNHRASNSELVVHSRARSLSTPLMYLPRSRPYTQPPSSLHPATFTPRLDSRLDWQAFTMTIKSKRSSKGVQPGLEDIESKLYLHTTRIFPITQSIPFYLSFLSSSGTLAAFMPFGPQTPGSAGSSVFDIVEYRCTRIRLTRQVIVDAKNLNLRAQGASVVQREQGRDRSPSLSGPISSSPEMWDMTTIGEGSFKLFVSWLFPSTLPRLR